MIWIFCTLIAATLQSFRNLEQKKLNARLSAATVSWSRFILPLPISIIVIFLTFKSVPSHFILYAFIMSVFQVLGNVFLLKTFDSKNFSIGIAFFKTEILQTMILGILVFGEPISIGGFFAIMLTVAGIILMSGLTFNEGTKGFLKSIKNRAALNGLLSGFFFAIAAFSLKASSKSLIDIGYTNLTAPLITLLWVIFFQNILFIILKAAQDTLIKDFKSLFLPENRVSFFKNASLSFFGSIFWFIAYTVGTVVYVKTVSQIELVMAIMISHYILKERLKKIEKWGIAFTAVGILGVILFR